VRFPSSVQFILIIPLIQWLTFLPPEGLCCLRELAEADKIITNANGMFGTIADKIAISFNSNKEVIRPVTKPIHQQGGLAVLFGNIARRECYRQILSCGKRSLEVYRTCRRYMTHKTMLGMPYLRMKSSLVMLLLSDTKGLRVSGDASYGNIHGCSSG